MVPGRTGMNVIACDRRNAYEGIFRRMGKQAMESSLFGVKRISLTFRSKLHAV